MALCSLAAPSKLQCAERQNLVLLSHDPPRITRSTFPFVFYFSPKEVSRDNWDSEYFDVTMDYFYSREVFDQNWFNNTPSEEIEKILTKAGKNVFLVDKSYLYNGKYIMLRVFYEKNSTNH